ncbi:hypothetical protein BaRGS_00028020 [Batillaria attramentaria]|uniref:Uncharacterized protein n=1 Tax=Batillaria attramentaria TaxID=370345 RepID=A0ABD0K0V6_9CAEN
MKQPIPFCPHGRRSVSVGSGEVANSTHGLDFLVGLLQTPAARYGGWMLGKVQPFRSWQRTMEWSSDRSGFRLYAYVYHILFRLLKNLAFQLASATEDRRYKLINYLKT